MKLFPYDCTRKIRTVTNRLSSYRQCPNCLFNYLYARNTGGKFLLRIEDTDLARSTEESTRSILDGLAWLELDHDEEIVFQSDNADKHRATARKLLAEGKAYRDFTPKVEADRANVKDSDQRACPCRTGRKRTCATIRIAIFQPKKAMPVPLPANRLRFV